MADEPKNKPSEPSAPVPDIPEAKKVPTPGLSYSPGLVEVPDSKVPATATGDMVSHVYGPGQMAADPIAAGLDTIYKGEGDSARKVIQTGEIGAGPRPTTYLDKTGPKNPVKQAAPADAQEVTVKDGPT